MTASKRKESQVSCFTRFMSVISSRRPGQESHQLRASLGYRCRHFPKHNQNKQAKRKETNKCWQLGKFQPWCITAGMSNDAVLIKNCLKISQKFNSEFLHGPSVLPWTHFPKDWMPCPGTAVPSCADGGTVILAETWKQFPVPLRMADNKMNPTYPELMEYLSLENEICDTLQLTWTLRTLYSAKETSHQSANM